MFKNKFKKNYKGASLVELMVALSIFALIAIIGFTSFSFMLNNQFKTQQQIENDILSKARKLTCYKRFYVAQCKSNPTLCPYPADEKLSSTCP